MMCREEGEALTQHGMLIIIISEMTTLYFSERGFHQVLADRDIRTIPIIDPDVPFGSIRFTDEDVETGYRDFVVNGERKCIDNVPIGDYTYPDVPGIEEPNNHTYFPITDMVRDQCGDIRPMYLCSCVAVYIPQCARLKEDGNIELFVLVCVGKGTNIISVDKPCDDEIFYVGVVQNRGLTYDDFFYLIVISMSGNAYVSSINTTTDIKISFTQIVGCNVDTDNLRYIGMENYRPVFIIGDTVEWWVDIYEGECTRCDITGVLSIGGLVKVK